MAVAAGGAARWTALTCQMPHKLSLREGWKVPL